MIQFVIASAWLNEKHYNLVDALEDQDSKCNGEIECGFSVLAPQTLKYEGNHYILFENS